MRLQRTTQLTGADDRPRRSGVATVWLVGFAPALLALLVLVTEIASLWLARIELETAAEAGALAAATVWGRGANDSLTRSTAISTAQEFAQANTISGDTPLLLPGDVTLGRYSAGVFDSTSLDPAPTDERACLVHATIEVTGFWSGFGGPRQIQASATARFDSASGTPRLVRVESTVP